VHVPLSFLSLHFISHYLQSVAGAFHASATGGEPLGVASRSEFVTERANCGKSVSPDQWESGECNPPGRPGPLRPPFCLRGVDDLDEAESAEEHHRRANVQGWDGDLVEVHGVAPGTEEPRAASFARRSCSTI
jgi:hypothetical protein